MAALGDNEDLAADLTALLPQHITGFFDRVQGPTRRLANPRQIGAMDPQHLASCLASDPSTLASMHRYGLDPPQTKSRPEDVCPAPFFGMHPAEHQAENPWWEPVEHAPRQHPTAMPSDGRTMPHYVKMEPSANGQPNRSGKRSFEWVDESVQYLSTKAKRRVLPATDSTLKIKACLQCREKKVRCERKYAGGPCDYCARKGFICEEQPTCTQPTSMQPDSDSFLRACVDRASSSIWALVEKGSGVVRSTLGFHSMLQEKIGFDLRHLGWVATALMLRRRTIEQERAEQSVDNTQHAHGSEMKSSPWLCNPSCPSNVFCDYATRWLKVVPDALIRAAEESFPRHNLLSHRQHCQWIPGHLPQLHGPDPVFITTVVFGKVSKYSNGAWNEILPDVNEVNKYVRSQTTELTPLITSGLTALFSVVPEHQQGVLASKYFWNWLTNLKMVQIAGTDIPAHYTAVLEFTTPCTLKDGVKASCCFIIHTCFQNGGGLLCRTIRCIVLPLSLSQQTGLQAKSLSDGPEDCEIEFVSRRHNLG